MNEKVFAVHWPGFGFGQNFQIRSYDNEHKSKKKEL
jgi:hypothetical protein